MMKQELFTHTLINKGFQIPNALENTKYDIPPKRFSQCLYLRLHLTHELFNY